MGLVLCRFVSKKKYRTALIQCIIWYFRPQKYIVTDASVHLMEHGYRNEIKIYCEIFSVERFHKHWYNWAYGAKVRQWIVIPVFVDIFHHKSLLTFTRGQPCRHCLTCTWAFMAFVSAQMARYLMDHQTNKCLGPVGEALWQLWPNLSRDWGLLNRFPPFKYFH